MKSIQEAMKFIFEMENIHSKVQLDLWCGNRGREKLYYYVKELAPFHWNQLEKPECTCRSFYQTRLYGYLIYSKL